MRNKLKKFVLLRRKKLDIMKRLYVFSLILMGFLGISHAQEHRRYALMWHDEFNTLTLDTKVWSKIYRNKADWAVHMSSHDTLYAFEDGDLVLRGMVNDFLPNDKAPFLTGGVWSKHRKAFGFGRLEIRAKFDVAQGYWPAIWMMPEANHAINWPYGGEIDIMEHFRDNPYINHTVHSHYTYNLGKRNRPSHVAYPKYNQGEYNIYGMERFQDSLVFFLNGRRTLNYPRFRNGENGQFPFSQHDYYLIMDAQLGRDRSPYIDTARLPVELRIDYVRYYELDTKTDVIPEPADYHQYTRRRYRFRKIVVNEKETFSNPDEYHIITRRGKATVSGNVKWAQSTLTQLIGEDGKIANVDFYDKPACPYRGISLDRYNKKWTFNEIKQLLDVMAFYKLNYLLWNSDGECSEEEVNNLREYASDLGIQMIDDIPNVADVGLFSMANDGRFPLVNKVFLKIAYGQGGFLSLNEFGDEELEALMAFSERYWRGGSAGKITNNEGLPDTLSEAGTRLANFKEKVAIHRARFHQK